MRSSTPRFVRLLIGLVLALGSTAPALADDSEVFTSTAYLTQNKVRPNILFIIDTSGSMDTAEPNYDPKVTYSGPCDGNVIYWRKGNSATPPACPSTQQIAVSANTCKASLSKLSKAGVFNDNIQQFNPNTPNVTRDTWQDLAAGKSNLKVECQDDDRSHGETDGSSLKRAANVPGGWAADTSISWRNKNHTLYTGNYANWYYGTDVGSRLTRLDIVRDAAKELADTLKGVNLGLMRYDPGAEGGMITVPVAELTDTQRTTIKSALDGYTAAGFTPLSETLYEAGLYFAGLAPYYGANSTPKSTPDSIEGGKYKSPEKYSCQKNYIVYLTDGLPTEDQSANGRIATFDPNGAAGDSKGQPNDFQAVTGRSACSPTTNPDSDWLGHGECLDDMAEYLDKVDMRADLYGTQNVTTFMIGFGADVKASQSYLDNVAKAGGSDHAYTASNAASLTTTLEEIFSKVADDANLTFTSPTVSVNAFNRAQNLSDLYVSVFSPSEHLHWEGNLKKYSLVDSVIYGVDPANSAGTVPAVNPATGFFYEDARSFWSTETDGLDVTKGGAASKLPDYAETSTGRKLSTYLGTSASLNDASNQIKATNTALTETLLGLDAGDSTGRANVIAFARGEDLSDVDGDTVKTEISHVMGDPMHASPAVVIYGGTKGAPDVTDALAFVPTNDGYLHAIDTRTGVEKWAFVPREMLTRLKDEFANPVIAPERTYGLDGDVRVFKYDVNRDGIISYADGDRVYLYFGFGRGGKTYYALDVSQHSSSGSDTPQFLWKKDATSLTGLGDAWSTPVIARVNVSDKTQNDGKYVLIFGGGYDPNGQEAYNYSADTVGNRVFMLDALSGTLLWSAGPETSTADLKLKKMNNSIPGRITVLDSDNDGFADRMYFGDMGGRVWRFDVSSGNGSDSLVTGGVFASLGAGDQETVVRADSRRFYYAPDVALFAPNGSRPFYNIAIGSGYRGHPLEEDTQDRFYSLRDYDVFTKFSQTQYDDSARKIIQDGDAALVDVTSSVNVTVGDGAPGWKLQLKSSDGRWLGEKVMAESLTAGGTILFTTFQPNGQNADNPCLPRTLNRVYAVHAEDARPSFDTNHDGDMNDVADRSQNLNQGGIASGPSLIPNNKGPQKCTKGAANCVCKTDTQCYTVPPPVACTQGQKDCVCKTEGDCHIEKPAATCLVGVEVLGVCVDPQGLVRTYWNRK